MGWSESKGKVVGSRVVRCLTKHNPHLIAPYCIHSIARIVYVLRVVRPKCTTLYASLYVLLSTSPRSYQQDSLSKNAATSDFPSSSQRMIPSSLQKKVSASSSSVSECRLIFANE